MKFTTYLTFAVAVAAAAALISARGAADDAPALDAGISTEPV